MPNHAFSLSAGQAVSTYSKLLALAGAVMLTVAVGGDWWRLLPQVPTELRLAVHGTVAPLLGVLAFRRPMPDMRFSQGHAALAIVAVAYVAAVMLITGQFGFERTYSDPRVSLTVAGVAGLALWTTHAMGIQPATTSGISGWWQIGLALIAAVSFAKAWDSGTSVGGELVAEFVLVGMTEEFAFRGVIQGLLEQAWRGRCLGLSSANWVTALLFAWYHNPQFSVDQLPRFLYLLPMGLFFGALRDRTGSWLLPGIAHGLESPLLYSLSLLGLVQLPLAQ